MPLTKIDYSNTIIYKLCCKDLSITDIYIGHTTDFRRRKYQHKSNCNNIKDKKYNLNVYKFIRDNGNWNNWDMIEIERFEAIDGNDAKKKERYWIETLKATLNTEIPGRTPKEYSKEYYKDNKETIAEKHKEYYKKWYENNKETLTEKQKEYREKNKETLAERKKEIIQCECGCKIRKNDISRHKQSKKHIDLISMINDKI